MVSMAQDAWLGCDIWLVHWEALAADCGLGRGFSSMVQPFEMLS